MSDVAQTSTVNTTNTVITLPDQAPDFVKIRNLDAANGVWIRLKNDTSAAVAEADENEFIGPGDSVLVPYQRQYRMIAIGASVKVNIVSALGRI